MKHRFCNDGNFEAGPKEMLLGDIMTFCIMLLSIMTFSITTLSTMTISITITKAGHSAYTTLRLCLLAVILSVIMLSFVMLGVTFSYCFAEFFMMGIVERLASDKHSSLLGPFISYE
jgi:hypothetical protein